MLADLDEWIAATVDPDPGIETSIVTEPLPTEQPERGVEVTLDDLDQDEVAEVKAMIEAPGLSDEEKAKMDALLDELDIIVEHDLDAMLAPLNVEDSAETPIVTTPQPAKLVDTAE